MLLQLITVACEEMRIGKLLYRRRRFACRSESPQQEHEADAAENDYEVEKVLSERGVGADKKYLVKWVGYSKPSWEPAANLDNCDARIDEFDPGFDEIISDNE